MITVVTFYARQHIRYTTEIPSVRLSICPSVTRVLCIKTAERIIEIFYYLIGPSF